MLGYTKLFSTLVTSTIWQQPNDCRVLWITLLALKDGDDICRATIPYLAQACNLTLQQTETYLEHFQQPDPYSRSQEFEGRRIKKVEEGWFILNGGYYRNLLRSYERRDYLREKQREHRRKLKKSTALSTMSTMSTDTDTYTNTDKNKEEIYIGHFLNDFWLEFPRKVAKPAALKAWKSLKLSEQDIEKVIEALKRQKDTTWKDKAKDYIPHPATWLNNRRWEDEIEPTWQEKFREQMKAKGST